MQLIFVDESTPGDWFVLGAFGIDARKWYGLDDAIDGVLGEDHADKIDSLKVLRQRDGPFTPELSSSLSFDIYDYLDANVPYIVWGVIVDKDEFDYDTIEAYRSALVLLFERLQLYLKRIDDIGAVFIDEKQGVEKELRDTDYNLKKHGTFYQDITRLVGVLTPIKDEHSIGVQLADWMASAIQGYYIQNNDKYFKRIWPHLDRHPNKNTVKGVGIKVIPDKSMGKLTNKPGREANE